VSDRTCKYCGADIRWCRDDAGHWLPLDVVKIAATEPRAEYIVVGTDDARRIAKANRDRFPTLYRRHKCEQGENARALQKRASADARKRLDEVHATLPGNVRVFRGKR
jgi:hypothetical protein